MIGKDKFIRGTITATGLLICAITLLVIVDNIWMPDTDFFGSWGGSQQMAFPTAACLLLTGSAFVLLATPPRKQ
jgi:hypothetical protein